MSQFKARGDQGVRQAVNLVTNNKKSLMMAKYGLTALGELCSNTKPMYKEKALEAVLIEQGAVLSAMNELASKFTATTPDQAKAMMSIMAGILDGLESYPSAEASRILASPETGQLVAKLTSYSTDDPSGGSKLARLVRVAAATNLIGESEVTAVGTALLDRCANPECPTDQKNDMIIALAALMDKQDKCIAAVVEKGAAEQLLEVVKTLDVKQRPAQKTTESILKCIDKFKKGNLTSKIQQSTRLALLEEMQNISAATTTQKRLNELAKTVMGGLFTDEEFSRGLADLRSPDSKSRLAALKVTAALCTDSSKAQQLVSTGAVPALIKASREAATLLSSTPGDVGLQQTFNATEAVISTVAASSETGTETIIAAGGMASVVEILENVNLADFPSVSHTVCELMSILCQEESAAMEALNMGCVDKILKLVRENCMKPDFPAAPLVFLARISPFPALAPELTSRGCFETCAFAIQHHVTDTSYQLAACETMWNLCAEVTDLTKISQCGGFIAIANLMVANCGDGMLCLKAMEVILYLCAVTGAEKHCAVPQLIDAICLVNYIHKTDTTVDTMAKEILEAVCTSADLKRANDALAALRRWKSSPDAAFAAVACAAILCHVSTLSAALQQVNLAKELLEPANDLLTGQNEIFQNESLQYAFYGGGTIGQLLYQAVLGAGGFCLSRGSQSQIDATLPLFCQTLSNTTLHRQILEQPDREDILVEGLHSLVEVLQSDKATSSGAFKSCATALVKISTIFSTQTAILVPTSEALSSLIRAKNGSGADALFAENGPNCLVNMCRRAMISKAILSAIKNIRLFITSCTVREQCLLAFKHEGTVQVVMSAIKASGGDSAVRDEAGKLIPLLMDEDEAEQIAMSCIKGIMDSRNADERTRVSAIRTANGFAASPLVARALARQGFGELACEILQDVKQFTDQKLAHEGQLEGISLLSQVAAVPQAVTKMKSGILLKTVADTLHQMVNSGDAQGATQALSAAQQLMSDDREVVKQTGLVQAVCKATEAFKGDARVLEEAGNAMRKLVTNNQTRDLVPAKDVKKMIDQATSQLSAVTGRAEEQKTLVTFIRNLAADSPRDLASSVQVLKTIDNMLETDKEGEAATEAMRLLEQIQTTRADWIKATGDTKLDKLAQHVTDFIKASADDSEKVAMAINTFARICETGKDEAVKTLLFDGGVNAIIAKHEGNKELKKAVVALSEKLPPVGAELDTHIQAAAKAIASRDIQAANKVMAVLLTALKAPISDPSGALQYLDHLLKAIASSQILTSNPHDAGAKSLGASCIKLMGSLHSKFGEDPQSPFGIQLLNSSGCAESLLMVTANEVTHSTKAALVRTAAIILATMVEDPTLREPVLALHASHPVATDLLEIFEGEPETKTAVLNLLSKIVTGPPSSHLKKVLQDQRWRAKALDLIMGQANTASMSARSLQDLLTTVCAMAEAAGGSLQGKPEGKALTDLSPIVCNVINDLTMVPPETIDTVFTHIEQLLKSSMRAEALNEMQTVSPYLTSLGGESKSRKIYLANLTALAQQGAMEEILGYKLNQVLSEILSSAHPEVVSVCQAVQAQITAGGKDVGRQILFLQDVAEGLLLSNQTHTDPGSLSAALKLFLQAFSDKESLDKMINRQDLMDGLAKLGVCSAASQCGDLLKQIYACFDSVLDDQGGISRFVFSNGRVTREDVLKPLEGAPPPGELTLRKVYEFLRARLKNGEEISPFRDTDPILQQHFEFVWDRLAAYAQVERLTESMFAGDEIKWGCLSYEAWLENDYDLCASCLEWGVHTDILLGGVILCQQTGTYKDVNICTPASTALVAIGSHAEPGGQTLASIEGIQETCMFNVRCCLDDGLTGDHITPRLQLIEKVAVDRSVFENQAMVELLSEVWDKVDSGACGPGALKALLRVLRKTLNSNYLDAIDSHKIAGRLLSVLKLAMDNSLIVDCLYLLGTMATFPKLKNLLTSAKSCELLVRIMQDHFSDGPGIGVLTNAQSALGTLVLDHRGNTDKFVATGGPKAVVWVVYNRAGEWQEVNAAAALIANSSYKRDDVKARYGSKEINAAEALAYALSVYDGSSNETVLRCLNSIFKAIANIALYVDNIEPLMQGGLDEAYFKLLSQAESLPDPNLVSCLITLSNLMAEYNPQYATKFTGIIEYLVLLLRTREDPVLLALTVNVLGSLTRLAQNAQEFGRVGGIETLIGVMVNYGLVSSDLLRGGSNCMAEMARSTENAEALLANDALSLITAIVNGNLFAEGCPMMKQNEIRMLCFRTLRRLIAAYPSAQTFSAFLEAGGLETFVWMLEVMAGADDVMGQSVFETFAFGVGLFQTFSPDPATVDFHSPLCLILTGEEPVGKPAAAAYTRLTYSDSMTYWKLDATTACRLLAAVALVLNKDAYRQNERSVRLGLMLMCLMTIHIPMVETMTETLVGGGPYGHVLIESSKRIANTLQTLGRVNAEILEIVFQMVVDFGYNFGGEALAVHFSPKEDLYSVISTLTADCPKQLKRGSQDFLGLWKKAAGKSDTESIFGHLVQYHISVLRLSPWQNDTYQNGIQDLPFKEALRRGGVCETVDEERQPIPFLWRSSQNLKMLQWKTGRDTGLDIKDVRKSTAKAGGDELGSTISLAPFNLATMEFLGGTAVARLKIEKGATIQKLIDISSHPIKGIKTNLLLGLTGAPTAENPTGDELGLVFKSKEERDEMYTVLFEWRAALSS